MSMDKGDIDFSEIEQAIERHKARLDAERKIEKEIEKEVVSDKVVKNPTKKPSPLKKNKTKIADQKPKLTKEDDNGEVIAVRIKPKSVAIKPNPRVGKVMDIMGTPKAQNILAATVSAVSKPPESFNIDSAADADVISDQVDIGTVTDALRKLDFNIEDSEEIVAHEETISVTVVPADKQPITVGDAIDAMDNEADFEPDDFGLDNLPLDSFEPPKFLDKVVVEQRPLGGGDPITREIDMRELLMAEESLPIDQVAEIKADYEFITDTPLVEKSHMPAVERPIQDSSALDIRPAGKKSNTGFYILLVVLLIILGGSIGAFLYFSGIINI